MKQEFRMEKLVLQLFKICLAKEKNPEELDKNRIGFSRDKEFVFDSQMLLKNAETIYFLLMLLDLNKQQFTFEELKEVKRFHIEWTQLNYCLDALFSMANALGYVDSKKVEDEYVITKSW